MNTAATVLCIGIVLSSGSCQTAHSTDGALKVYAAAAMAWDAGDFSAALSLASSCLEIHRHFLPAVMLRGKALFLLGDDTSAIVALSSAISLTPRAGQAALWLARAYRTHGDHAEAERISRLALQSDPASIDMLRLASMIALDAGDSRAAQAFLDRAIEAAAEAGMAFVDRATLRWASGDRIGASADLAAALAILPTTSSASAAARAIAGAIAGATASATASTARDMTQGTTR
ncbi:MAG TPA: hypothetical protein VMX33_06625 [bacterium]|nr:hypothetical protein [bacterium]